MHQHAPVVAPQPKLSPQRVQVRGLVSAFCVMRGIMLRAGRLGEGKSPDRRLCDRRAHAPRARMRATTTRHAPR